MLKTILLFAIAIGVFVLGSIQQENTEKAEKTEVLQNGQ